MHFIKKVDLELKINSIKESEWKKILLQNCISVFLYPCMCLFISPWLRVEKKMPWARRGVFTAHIHFAPAPVVPQALHSRTNLQVFWADSRQLGWKFSHCFTGCGGTHVITWKDLRTKVSHLLWPRPGCPLKPESQYCICYLLCSSSFCRRKRGLQGPKELLWTFLTSLWTHVGPF